MSAVTIHRELEMAKPFFESLCEDKRKTRHVILLTDDCKPVLLLSSFSNRIADILEHCCKVNDAAVSFPAKNSYEASFYSQVKQDFGLRDYIEYVVQQTSCSRSVYILGLVYMMRAQKANSYFQICSFNVHRLFTTCTLIAAKYLEHIPPLNSKFGTVCGVSELQKINGLEIFMLQTLNYNLCCKRLAYEFIFRSLLW